ncbi:DUF2141 domain-containing protein [Lutibacter flavus]|uniref:Uncharacterized conserved protein, DUF2141 family n=1 Tax=Lutibacter flavus TaxID=691689 RepID=A0A238VEG6_9FLAO|nr:DUF2141 domain-containing protein [Lutibacter flavus]SNR32554.1 Uncharacterized conserved protein, DUF2141 family [Lutibacter flavus]
MQHLILAIAMLFSSIIVAQESSKSTKNEFKSVKVSVVNATNDKGEIEFALFNEENFRKESLESISSTIKNGVSTVTFKGLLEGSYAIICYHDANENGKMDFAENGMPIENYGASNNVMNFGPPQFEDSKFVVSKNDLSLEIKF